MIVKKIIGLSLLLMLLVGVAKAQVHPVSVGQGQVQTSVPDGFVFVEDLIPGLVVDLRYTGNDNFLGRPVDGYEGARPVLSRPAAEALARVQKDLGAFGLGLKIFDAYRPRRAVNHFVRWARDVNDVKEKARYYPKVDKSRLFADGYIAERSGHSRGSTVDLTIVALPINEGEIQELDMGSGFDYLSPESWPLSKVPTAIQRAHRALLHFLMKKHGFKPYEQEWWHFTLSNEPYPDTYFDFLPRR